MHRILLHHLTGSKAQQTDDIPFDQARDILVGREPGSKVQFDPVRDDLVGKQHARILQDAGDQFKFSIVDLNSRNGTFVNRQRVAGTVALNSGDIVQLGPGGPEFRFEIDPLPAQLMKPTRVAGGDMAPVPPTRVADRPDAPPPGGFVPPRAGGVGRDTVLGIVTEQQRKSRRSMWIGLAAALAVVAAGAWYFRMQSERRAEEERASAPWTTERTASEFTGSTVMVEFAWKLALSSGEQIFHEYELVDRDAAPVFYERDDSVWPMLTTRAAYLNHPNRPISCDGSGSGFAVTTDGFIMTNRHVAANWEAPYQCFPPQGAAVVYHADTKQRRVADIRTLSLGWVPAAGGRMVSGKVYEGQNTYLEVLFKQNKLRFPATLARVSDRHDVALIKINTPQPVKKVDLLLEDKDVRVGQAISVMGYPGVSPGSLTRVQSSDPLVRDRETIVPDPTVTPGSIGRILSGQGTNGQQNAPQFLSGFGDTYQLTVNATGAGNSGGPVLDDHGHVIGIFTYRKWDRQGTSITFAVPIRYGLELMGTSPSGGSR